VARRLVTEADQTAVARIKEATRQVEALRTLRRQVTSQLESVSTKLEEALRHLAPTGDGDDVLAGGPAQQS
jgi:GTP1/Obg family GTP-binding protein